MQTISDLGVVLRSRLFGEYDALLTLFTKHSGKVTVLAKGLRRSTSRMSGILQPFSVVSFERSVPKNEQSLAKLIRADLSSPPPDFFEDSFVCLELAEKISREGQEVSKFFDLLSDFSSASDFSRILPVFFLKTLTIFGYLSLYEKCEKCAEKFSSAAYWQFSGEMICENCESGGLVIDFSEIKMLRFWQIARLNDCLKVDISDESRRKILSFLFRFLEEEQGIELKSVEYLD